MLRKDQCNEQRLSIEESPDRPQTDLEDPTRAKRKSELRDVSSEPLGDGLGAKGRRR